MSAIVVIGAQWGDEGKGKITDYLAKSSDLVIRYQGGNNAGHTVVVGDSEYKLHLLPSGILYEDKLCAIGNGVVVDLEVMLKEMKGLQERGVKIDGLRLSERAHLIMPYHRKLDEAQEMSKGEKKIGTTKRGIGPAYMDKISRVGIRVIDLMNAKVFEEKLRKNLAEKNLLLSKIYGLPEISIEEILPIYLDLAERVRPYVTDTSLLVDEKLRDNKNILFEGAQGTLLDIDHGTYPFVTSSNPIAGGACAGTGVGPTKIDKVIGVIKAYTTRVGEGPFPTELFDENGRLLSGEGNEFGTTTGRERRCGWFDAVILRYSVRVSGITDLVVTKLDVLDKMPKIKLCTGYSYQGEIIRDFPSDLAVLAHCEPVYEEMEGWQQNTSECKNFAELPLNAQRYIRKIEELAGVPASMVSVGPKRSQTMVRSDIY